MLPAGDFERGRELVSDLALVVETSKLEGTPSKLNSNSQLGVWLTDKRRLGATLMMATGSEPHIDQLRALAADRGLSLDEAGLHGGKRPVAALSRKYMERWFAIHRSGAPKGRGELELAKAHMIPRLVTDADIRGILHAHTDRSDGVDTLEVMAEATRHRGYQYFGGGRSLSISALCRPLVAEIDKLNSRYRGRFRIFKGIESDILADGSLDYQEEILDRFNFVVASVHSRLKLGRKEQTHRILTAVANPRTTILGHMTGRQLLRRLGYDVDIESILRSCAKRGVAMEINANQWRLDLDWRWHRRALELGCVLSVNPDAHSTDEIDLTHWGVEMARKGGVPADRILNTFTRLQISSYFRKRRLAPAE